MKLIPAIAVCSIAFSAISPNLTPEAQACSRKKPVSVGEMMHNADVIVRAQAVDYAVPPKDDRRGGMPDARVRFKVKEVLKGKPPKTLAFSGYLDEKDDFNDQPAPYQFVRPGGRHGNCFANTYKRNGEFLLFLKKTGPQKTASALTPYWDALAPVNEQLHSPKDPWLVWVKKALKSAKKGA